MARKAIAEFALKVLEIAHVGKVLGFEELWAEYKRSYGAIPFERFSGYVTEAFEAGLIELAGGTFPGAPDSEFTVKLTTAGAKKGKTYTSLWTKVHGPSVVKGIDKLKDELGVDVLRNANRELFDALVRNQIYLLRLSGQQRNEIIRLLEKTEKDIAENIVRRLGGRETSALGTRRLQLLEQYVKSVRLDAWDKVTEKWVSDMVDLAKSEVATTAGILKTTSPAILELTLPPASQLRAIVTGSPFEGKTLKQWASTIAKQDTDRMLDQIRIGLVQGESAQAIARRITGTAALKGTDGVTQITRRNAEAIVRTAINHVATQSRAALYEENDDILQKERYVATLDSRTTPICRSLDGKIYPRGVGPKPPVHWNCRSLRVPFFDDEAIGNRPARAFTQKQMLREFGASEGIDVGSTRDSLPRGYKSAFDDFARKRMRQLTSIVPSNETYQTWLTRQTAQFQDDVLGRTRARLFRQGGLTLDKFVNRAGDELPISALARMHKAAFKAAGLDPEDFL